MRTLLGNLGAALFPWRHVRTVGAWRYEEHGRTGARRAVSVIPGGYSPRDEHWLAGGVWRPPISCRPDAPAPVPMMAHTAALPLRHPSRHRGTPALDEALRHPPRPAPRPAPVSADTYRARIGVASIPLRAELYRQAEAGCATPQDTQLLAALDRWAAGDLA
jgi:hypothetical protein